MPQQATPMYTPSQPASQQQLRCSHCNTPYEKGDTFCTGCGRSLTPPRMYCSKCNSELKPGAAFCPKCGASSFQAVAANAQPQAPQTPPAQSAPPVTYAQPQAQQNPPTPTYTPPAQQKPPVPVYVPSNQVKPQRPTVTSYSTPTVASQPTVPTKPEEPLYVPPVTQTPSAVPQPKVTLVPGQQKKETPASPPPPRPQKVYYKPSNQAAADALTQAQQPIQEQPPAVSPSATTVQGRPVSPSIDPNAVWGILVLSSDESVQLKGDQAIVGRYDHDLEGGLQPDVDLSKQQGADTVSRIHATIEPVGSSFMLTDLNSTNASRVNNKRAEPDTPTSINDGDTLQFGSVTCTFKKA
jgi:hypothetical protein